MKEQQNPKARVDCLSRKFGDEILVYDKQRNVGHCLNSTAAATWKLCDGNRSASEVANILTQQLAAPIDESMVQLALEELAKARLLVEPEAPVRRTSRRDAIRRLGIAGAIALPLVTSLVAPTPARAASCGAKGAPCTMNSQCCSGNCNSNPGRCK